MTPITFHAWPDLSPAETRAVAYALAIVRTYLGESAKKIQFQNVEDVLRYADSIAVLLGTMPEGR